MEPWQQTHHVELGPKRTRNGAAERARRPVSLVSLRRVHFPFLQTESWEIHKTDGQTTPDRLVCPRQLPQSPCLHQVVPKLKPRRFLCKSVTFPKLLAGIFPESIRRHSGVFSLRSCLLWQHYLGWVFRWEEFRKNHTSVEKAAFTTVVQMNKSLFLCSGCHRNTF